MLQKLILTLSICLLALSCGAPETKTTATQTTDKVEQTQAAEAQKKTILFFGDSLTAAYKLDMEDGYTTIIQKMITEKGLNYKVVNAGLSGETSAGGLGRVDWLLKQKVDIVLLELGANDGLRGTKPAATKENLQKIIDKIKSTHPQAKIILAGMEALPNMGADFTSEFRAIFPALAKQNNLELIPFFLEGVAGDKALNLADGIHPNEAGQKIVAQNVWKVLEPML